MISKFGWAQFATGLFGIGSTCHGKRSVKTGKRRKGRSAYKVSKSEGKGDRSTGEDFGY